MLTKVTEVVALEYTCDLTGVCLGQFPKDQVPPTVAYKNDLKECVSQDALLRLPQILHNKVYLEAFLTALRDKEMEKFDDFFSDQNWIMTIYYDGVVLWKAQFYCLEDIAKEYEQSLANILDEKKDCFSDVFKTIYMVFNKGIHIKTITYDLSASLQMPTLASARETLQSMFTTGS